MRRKKNSSPLRTEKRTEVDPVSLARTFRESGDPAVHSDVEGSYTGVPREGITPIPDADDL